MKRWLDLLISGVLLLGAALLRADESAMALQLRNLVFDSYQRALPRAWQDLPVRIVDIDEESLKRLGQWPWPRNRLARMVDRLGEAGAAVVTIDILLSEPDRLAPSVLTTLWRDRPESASLQAVLRLLPDPDAELAASLARMPAVTAFVLKQEQGGRAPASKASFAIAGDDPRQFLQPYSGSTTTLPELEGAAAGNGSVTFVPDTDGVLRRVPLLVRYGDEIYPSLASEALRVAQGASNYIVKSSGASKEANFGGASGIAFLRIGEPIAPTDGDGRILLYDSGHRPERFMPAWRVLEKDFDPASVAGHILLIGTSAEALKDLRATPLDPAMAGVEIHAQVVEQIIAGQFLVRPDWATGAELVALVVFGLILIFAIRRAGALWALLIALAGGGAMVASSWYGFAARGWLIDPLYSCLVALLVYLSGSLIGYLRTEGEKRFVRGAFGRYLSPVLVEALTRNPERLRLGGETRRLTLLFSDIRGFTHIAESLDPTALTRLINRFLTPLTRVIQDSGGTIDKYMGDCIMAFWNAPLDVPDHAAKAVQAALAMRAELARLNDALAAEAAAAGGAPIRLGAGIGLNTGTASVGNMGSEQRFDYSVIGDTVNIASRLEGLSRAYGVDIVAGEETVRQAPGPAYLEIDQVRVKGRDTPLRVFTVLGDAAFAATEGFRRLVERHAAMIAAYRAQDWPAARGALAACRGEPAAPAELYELYERRIAGFTAVPPPANWDGVFLATSKQG